jgi:hypothetical protein
LNTGMARFFFRSATGKPLSRTPTGMEFTDRVEAADHARRSIGGMLFDEVVQRADVAGANDTIDLIIFIEDDCGKRVGSVSAAAQIRFVFND